jgi:arylsulfate sulfotransferase
VTRKIAFVALAFVLGACGDDNNSHTTQPKPPVVSSFSVAPNENNVLSAIASLALENADSAHIVYWTGSEAKQSTPFRSDLSSAGRAAVVGLRPETEYSMFVEAIGGGATASSDTLTFTTGALDPFLAASHLTGDPVLTGGYVIAALQNAADGYFTIFDSAGQVAWYKKFPAQTVAEMKQQANGDFTVILTTSHGGEPVIGSAVELALDGSTVRTFTAPSTSPYFDDHEFWLLFNDGTYDGALFLAYNQRTLDLSSTGGPSDSVVSGHQLIREDASGNQHVVFDAWDHFQLTDNVEPSPGQPDFDHPNAITFDTDGNYIVSWRNLDVITKINAATGDLMWTLASPLSARASDFTIANDPLNGFSAQHSSRILDSGHLLVFDNGTRHSTPASRVVEYQIDETAHTATMVWQYQHAPALFTQFTGSVQRLQNGNTFIGWTWPPVSGQEIASDGTTAWEAPLVTPRSQLPYRLTKIRSLYSYQKP